ncbi:MAG TPA: class I SAM-dependent methyltransferase [Acidimicrobiales bacterium]|nr:class I SAM-dependent methyltransferase [Acidimicrobiales bacterium]
MNENHARLCTSPEWAAHIQDEVLPNLTAIACLGEQMLELGPGPGSATEWLRLRVRGLVAVESDEAAVRQLAQRFAGTNVQVVLGDATDLPYPSASFDSVGSFTMLHHVATQELQQRLLAESYRVLRPGGVLIGSDSLASNELHHFHVADTYNPIEPSVLLNLLLALGFQRITLTVDGILRFVAHKPDPSVSECG